MHKISSIFMRLIYLFEDACDSLLSGGVNRKGIYFEDTHDALIDHSNGVKEAANFIAFMNYLVR